MEERKGATERKEKKGRKEQGMATIVIIFADENKVGVAKVLGKEKKVKGLDPFLAHCSCALLRRCLYVLYGVSRAHYPHVLVLETFLP